MVIAMQSSQRTKCISVPCSNTRVLLNSMPTQATLWR